MGSAVAVALGVADRCPDRSVIGLIGDGELLMGAGSLWSFAGMAPRNLLLVVLANGIYGITGRQELISDGHAAAVADALPPLHAAPADEPGELGRLVRQLQRPALIEARVTQPSWDLPSPFVDPTLTRDRFLARVQNAPPALSNS
jgi:thiamine pyrophosphate-dependent acetolactate synthase large subunit-like protein